MGILDEIVAHKRTEVKGLERNTNVPMCEVDFADVLRKPGADAPVRLIAEVKQKSPTAGDIRTVDVATRAQLYADSGASAISVLTDTKYFSGQVTYLGEAAKSGIPVLRKDFVIIPEQIYEARAHGATSILLMVHVHPTVEGLMAMINVCRTIGMEPLVEAHDEDSIQIAVDAGARIIGINARDFSKDDLPILPERFQRLLPRIPDHIVKVAESGISTRADVAAVEPLCDAILVGSALMQQGDAGLPDMIHTLLHTQ